MKKTDMNTAAATFTNMDMNVTMSGATNASGLRHLSGVGTPPGSIS